jgi:dTDP-4-dehydrorhamnose reductase
LIGNNQQQVERKIILITGSKGQLGNEFRFLAFRSPDFGFIYADVEELDITKPKSVEGFFQRNHIDYCINCAAYTAVDKAETSKSLAKRINVNGVKNLAQACEAHGATFFQISTDYVYHNTQNTPFKEGDKTSPKSVYARTKLSGDVAALKGCSRSVVMRTSWVYSTFGHNFVRTMLRFGKERETLSVVFDQIGTPTYARDLAFAILQMIRKVESGEVDRSALSGIYHYSNEGVTSWYDFTKAIFEIRDITCKLTPIETSAYPTPAKRPPFSVLNKAKLRSNFGIEIPYWRDSLIACLKEM